MHVRHSQSIRLEDVNKNAHDLAYRWMTLLTDASDYKWYKELRLQLKDIIKMCECSK